LVLTPEINEATLRWLSQPGTIMGNVNLGEFPDRWSKFQHAQALVRTIDFAAAFIPEAEVQKQRSLSALDVIEKRMLTPVPACPCSD
jgi:hypothetical protein